MADLTILAWDTASPRCVAALVRIKDGSGCQVLAERIGSDGLSHSQILPPLAHDLMRQAGLAPAELDLLAVGRGPGSFTGLRTGLSLAKGLSLGAGTPVVGVSTLEILAGAVFLEPENRETLAAPVIDARHNEVFTALYQIKDGQLERLTEPLALAPDALPDALWEKAAGRPVRLTGPALSLIPEHPGRPGTISRDLESRSPDPVVLARLAAERFRAEPSVARQPLVPLYVRPPDIRM